MMTRKLYMDLETYSPIDLKSAGVYRYAEEVEVMVCAYAIDAGPVKVWDVTADPAMPADLAEAWNDPNVEVVWHNGGMFDRTVLRLSPTWRYGVPAIERWHDTMVRAMAHSLPGGLEKLCDVLKVPLDKQKQKTGKALIQLFCKPRPKNMKLRRATRETHPKEWAQFLEYAAFDIEAMREVYKRLPRWNWTPKERALWHADMRINDRGVAVDLALVDGAIATVAAEQKYLAIKASKMTGGDVDAATQRDKLLAHLLADYGVSLPDMTKDTLERRLEDPDLPIEVKNLLGVRLEASTASVAKYRALRRGVSTDGRLRGLLVIYGAIRTGRWAGRLFQPQNLPRPSMDPADIEFAIECMKDGTAYVVLESPMKAASNAIRGVIVAARGKKLVVVDLSNIEGRMAAWLAGELWKLERFRAFDAGVGADLYAVAYAKAFATTTDEVMHDKKHGNGMKRQIGKVMELMLQYEGGVGAWITGAETYGIDLFDLTRVATPNIPTDTLDQARDFYAWMVDQGNSTYGLPAEVYVCLDSLKRLWRGAHPAIVSYWAELRDVVREAITTPGRVFEARKLLVDRIGNWLRIRLPSGRYLCYPSPRVNDKGAISYMGPNTYTRKWERIYTYGGKLLENITQAAARDVMAEAIIPAEAMGYETLLTVHDELITEAPDADDYSIGELADILSTVPDWAPGLPLAAAGFESYRYKKE